MVKLSFGHIVGLLFLFGVILFQTGILDGPTQGIAWLIVTVVALLFWVVEQFSQGFTAEIENRDE